MDAIDLPKPKYKDGMENAYYTIYRYKGIPYIPHYDKRDCYIPPGYTKPAPHMVDSQGRQLYYADVTVERTSTALEKAGATKEPMLLWKRNKSAGYREMY